MINRIRIRNFKSLHDVTVELGPFTVLIGQNGAGKSSFLQAIQILSWLIKFRSINEVLDAHHLTYSELVYLRGSSSAISWEVDLSIPDPTGSGDLIGVTVLIRLAKRKYVYVSLEVVVPKGANGQPSPPNPPFHVGRIQRSMVAKEGDSRISHENVTLPHSILLDVSLQPGKFPILAAVAKELAGFMHYEIWGPEVLRQSSTGPVGTLSERGENLASVLYALKTKDPERFAHLVDELRSAYPWLDSIEIRRPSEGLFALSFLERSTDLRQRRVKYQPSQVSDGFLRLLPLTTLKYQAEPSRIIGYEEPENGMHPGMLLESVSRLRDIVRLHKAQVILTTHSPFLLQDLLSDENGAGPEKELRLVWRGEDGKTVIRPPSRAILDQAKSQGVGMGELWGMLLDEKAMAAAEAPEEEG